jgi:hypothetical protein
MCVSHGRQDDPVQVPLSEEMVAEPITFLRLMPGGAVPPQGGPNPYCPLDVDGDFGPNTTMALQWKLGVARTGDFGPDTTPSDGGLVAACGGASTAGARHRRFG